MRGPWENNIAKRTLSDGATVYDWRVRRPRSQGGGFIHGTARALREAKAAKGDVEKQIRDKKYRKPVRQTLNAAGAAWLEAIKPPASKIRPVTWQGYINQFRYLEVHIGDKLVADVTGEDIDKMNAKLLIDGKLRSKGGLSPDSVRHVNVTGHKFYEYEIRKKRVDRNPFKDAEPIGSGRPEHDVWEALELQKFLESVKEDRLFALYRLEAVTGLRRSEIVALPWPAVDFEKKTISIHQTAAYQGQYAVEVLDMVKRDSSRRKVALDDQTITILRDHRKRQLEEQLAWGEIWNNPHGLVFVKEDGSTIHPETLSGWFDALVKASGLKRITFHEMRHTYATLALSNGVPVKVVSQRLGHASVRITYDLYSHVIPGDDQQAADTFIEKVL